jgi:HPr kinase/phosphorylase
VTGRSDPAATMHASCVAFGDTGILLCGPSGAGKSDIALRLIEAGAVLVADDRVLLSAERGDLHAAAPPALVGVLEIRGIGLVELPCLSSVIVRLVGDIVYAGPVERLPPPAWSEYLGIRIPQVAVAPFEQSAVAKLRIAAYDAAGQADPATGARRHEKDEPTR